MITKKEDSKMVFTLKHNTVNISKGTPDTDMRLAPLERAENFLSDDYFSFSWKRFVVKKKLINIGGNIIICPNEPFSPDIPNFYHD